VAAPAWRSAACSQGSNHKEDGRSTHPVQTSDPANSRSQISQPRPAPVPHIAMVKANAISGSRLNGPSHVAR
jgi:hypothetical protein